MGVYTLYGPLASCPFQSRMHVMCTTRFYFSARGMMCDGFWPHGFSVLHHAWLPWSFWRSPAGRLDAFCAVRKGAFSRSFMRSSSLNRACARTGVCFMRWESLRGLWWPLHYFYHDFIATVVCLHSFFAINERR